MRFITRLALAAACCAVMPVLALQPPEPRHLHDFEVRHADLWWGNVYRSVDELPPDLTRDLIPELGTMGVHPERAFLDVRTGRWGTLIVTRPMIPGSGVENDLQWSDLGRPAPDNRAELGQAAGQALGDFLIRFSDELGIRADELDQPRTATHGERLIQIHIPRQRDGIPVRDSYLTASINSGNLVLMGQKNWGDLDIDTRPAMDDQEAENILRQHLGELEYGRMRERPRLEIVPVSGQPDVSQVARVGGGLDYRLVWVLTPDFRDDIGTWEALVDAHNGELLAFEDTNHYHGSDDEHLHGSGSSARRLGGGVFPVTNDGVPPDGVEQAGFPMPFADIALDGSHAGYTTTGGNVPTGDDPGTIATALSGQFVTISDNCGAVNESAGGGDLDLGDGGGTDCAVPDGASAGNTASTRTSYYGLNRIIEQAQGYLPDNTWLQSTLTSNMNLNNSCNAFWNGTVNFYTSGEGCSNTGELMPVVHHEWGHGMDANSVNPGISRPGEGIADIYAQNILNDSCIGHNFRPGNTCAGFGDACLECTGVRESDWALQASGEPHDIDWVIGACTGSGNTPCGSSTHCEGSIIAEALWDLAHRDLRGFDGSNFDYDLNTALELSTRLTYMGAGPVGDWFQCNPDTSTGGGCNADSGYLQFLAVDADNGSIEDGTPHMSAIHDAFARHQLSCDTPTVQDSGCEQAPVSAPENLQVIDMNEGAELTWDTVDGASEYWIYRAEGPMGCEFGKARVGQTTNTAFVETGLRNELEVHYSVIAVGDNDACTSPMSDCESVVPFMGPSGNIQGAVVRGGSDEPLQGVMIQAEGDESFSGLTDEDGQFSLQVLEGTYNLTATRAPFSPASASDVVVSEGDLVSVDFVLDAPIADLSPDSFELSAGQGTTVSDVLEISNPGTLDLEWTIGTDGAGRVAASRGFEGDFDIDNWELVNDPAGVGGSVDVDDGPPIEVYVTGGDDGTGGNTDFEIEIPVDGTITFDWGYQSTDTACWDIGGYAINGGFVELACNEDAVPYFDETESVEVSAGDVFAFRVFTEDGQFGPGVLGVTSFEFEPAICADFRTDSWLSASPASGTVSPDTTGTTDILANTAGLEEGDHEAHLCVSTNDPDAAMIPVPVLLTVTDDKPVDDPELEVSPGAFAFSVTEGDSDSDTLFIENIGQGLLTWDLFTGEAAGGQGYGFLSAMPGASLPMGHERSAGIEPEGQASRFVPGAQQLLAIDQDFEEGFEDVPALPDAGWVMQNNSDPEGSTGWFQGNIATFSAHEGPADSYVAANFTNAEIGGTISNWLLTPEIEFNEGTEITFWTRTSTDPDFADRLQVRLSDQGPSDDVGSGAGDVGDFTELLEEINPDEAVAGYPQEWTEYTLVLDESFDGQTGRIAFRYYIPDTTSSGNYIGIDTFSVSQPDDSGQPPPGCETPVAIDWLDLTPDSGTTDAGSTSEVAVTVDSDGLEPGSHEATLCIDSNDPAEPLVAVPVELQVLEQPDPPMIDVDPGSLAATLEEGQVDTQAVIIANDGEQTLEWNIDDGGDCELPGWAAADPLSGSLAATDSEQVDVTFDATGLEPGNYDGTLCVASNDPQTPLVEVELALNVIETTAVIDGTVTSQGYCADNPVAAAGANIQIDGQENSYQVTADGDGVYQIELPADESPVDMTVSAPDHADGFETGVSFEAGDTVTVDFDLVLQAPCATVDPQDFDLVLVVGDSQSHSLAIGNVDGAVVLDWSIEVADGASQCADPGPVEWLEIDPVSGQVAAGESVDVTVDVDAGGLEPGEHDAWLCVTTDDAQAGSFEVPVALLVLATEIFEDRFEETGED